MFLINSRMGHFSAACQKIGEALLIPKLRSYFAEFLSCSSLDHLRILISSTCVGLRYGHPISCNEAFLGNLIRRSSPEGSYSGFMIDTTDLPIISHYTLEPAIPTAGTAFTFASLLYFITISWWYRNINLFPIEYAFRPLLRIRLTLRR